MGPLNSSANIVLSGKKMAYFHLLQFVGFMMLHYLVSA